MADSIVHQSAQSVFHDGLKSGEGEPVVVFNPRAQIIDLISYAHGQLEILTRMLETATTVTPPTDESKRDEAILDMIRLASSALELAATKDYLIKKH